MDQVIVAFESEKTCWRIKEILERSGTAACLICRSGDQVRRYANKQRIGVVICGYKLGDETAEDIANDLPHTSAVLLLAHRSQLDMVSGDRLFSLAAPAPRGELIASVRTLLCLDGREEKLTSARRSREEQEQIHRAKLLLMERNGLTEEQAHRFLQKRSMDAGLKLAQTAQMVLEES